MLYISFELIIRISKFVFEYSNTLRIFEYSPNIQVRIMCVTTQLQLYT